MRFGSGDAVGSGQSSARCDSGQMITTAGPTRLSVGTGPKARESLEWFRLSPITQTCPSGTHRPEGIPCRLGNVGLHERLAVDEHLPVASFHDLAGEGDHPLQVMG